MYTTKLCIDVIYTRQIETFIHSSEAFYTLSIFSLELSLEATKATRDVSN